MSIQIRKLLRAMLFVVCSAAVTSCGGGAGDTATVAVPETPVGDDKGSNTNLSAALPMETWLAQGIVFEDRDGDGIEDHLDSRPDDPPLLADPFANQSLTVLRAWTEIDDETVTSTAVDGKALQLQVAGLPATGGHDQWVVFQTSDGLRAVRATVAAEGRLTVYPVPGAFGLHVVSGSLRGADLRLQSIGVDRPLLFDTGAIHKAGHPAHLAGANIERVEQVFLGPEELPILEKADGQLVVDLPAAPSSNRLTIQQAGLPAHAVALNLRQDVELSLGIELAAGEELRFRQDGISYRLSAGQPAVVSVPAWQATVLSFDIVSGEATRSYGRLRAVIWPGDTTASVTAESSLVGRMLGIRHLLDGFGGTDWGAIRAAGVAASETSAAADYAAALRAHAAGDSSPVPESMVVTAVQAYNALAATTAATNDKFGPAINEAARTTTGKELDSIIGTTLTYADESTSENDSIGAGYSFPQQTSGSEYSQVVVLRHTDDNFVSTGFRSFGGCSFSDDEKLWAASAQLWPSDLCVEIVGLPFISAGVVMPGFGSAQAVFDKVASGQRSSQLVRRHSKADLLDQNYQWGTGGYYLRSDKGRPLCHMETCYIEVITSGYGAYHKVALTSAQQELVETLRTRMWVEAIIPWLEGVLGDIQSTNNNDSDPGNDISISGPDPVACIKKDLMKNGGFYQAAKNLEDFIKANRHKTGDDLVLAMYDGVDQKIAPWVRNYVSNQAGTAFLQCLKSYNAVDEVLNGIKDKLIQTAGLSAFLEIFQFVQKLGSVVLTPEKFVFKVQYRAEIQSISPREINLYEDRNLYIEGTWLMRTDAPAASPCSGDNYCPTLLAVDRLGLVAEIPLDETHMTPPASDCGLGCTGLEIPYSDLAPLQNLTSGPLRLELTLADADFTGYPGGRLRIPVPGNVMRLRTRAKIQSIDPPLAKAGETITVKGTSLTAFGDAPVYELVDENGLFPNISLEQRESSPTPDETVRLVVPAGTLNGVYRVLLKPGAGATATGSLESEFILPVVDSDRQWVVVGDHGEVKDDWIRVEFLDANDNLVRFNRNDRALSFDLPTNELNPPAGAYVSGYAWDDSINPDTGDLVDVTEYVAKIRVTCVTPQQDQTCSWGIRSQKDKLCIVRGLDPRPSFTAKVRKGEVRDYYTAPGESSCAQVVPPP